MMLSHMNLHMAHFWMPAEKIDEATERDAIPYWTYVKRGFLSLSGDNFVDYHDCYNWLTELVEKYEILPLQVGYDRYSANYLIQDLNNGGTMEWAVMFPKSLYSTRL